MEKIIFDELDYEDMDLMENDFYALFNNEYENKEYAMHGDIGLWDGVRYGYSDKVFNSIYDAICDLKDGYITVYEEKYGKLMVKNSHHDGTDYIEIKELTPLGRELIDNGYDGNICKRKGATKNVRFVKNYL